MNAVRLITITEPELEAMMDRGPTAHMKPGCDPNIKIATYVIDDIFIGSYAGYEITHWMPLPEPPKVGG